MTVTEVITDGYRSYRGKTTNVPTEGSAKWIDILGILNRKVREWAQDPNVDWPSRFELRSLGLLVSGTQSYDLDDDIIRPSDYALIGETEVAIIRPQIRTRYTTGCYISGFDPKQLTFVQTIGTSEAGETLTLPCLTLPADMVAGTDIVVVDNPQWLVYAIAAELARNDYAKEEQYPNLNGIANTLYQQMIDSANATPFLQANGVPNAMPQISSYGDIS